MNSSPPAFSVHGDSPGRNTGVGCHALLQGIFPTQGSNPDLPHCRQILYHLSHQRSLFYVQWCMYINSTLLIHPSPSPFPFGNHGGGLVTKSCPTLVTPWTVACQAPLSMGFSRQEYWSGLPFPSPGDLPDPGISISFFFLAALPV